VIPDEAVDAAAKAVWERGETIQTHEYATEIARLALEAAAPHLVASLADEREGDLFRFTLAQREWLRTR
jgi:hypothetical protein